MTEVEDNRSDAGGLRDVAARLDAERFVGRGRELRQIDDLLMGEGPTRLLYIHGPGGIGKSALLREAARRADGLGRTAFTIDGRVVPPAADALEVALAPAFADPRAVVIVDEMDPLVSLRFELRDLLLTRLGSASVVILAGRRAPERVWFEDGVEHLIDELPLRPLPADDARSLLERYGVDADDDNLDPVLQWSAGYPLALTLAARVTARDGSLPTRGIAASAGSPPDVSALGDLLLGRLAGRELDEIDRSVLEVAALAPAVDARLLAVVLPGRSTRAALKQLRELSVSERIGTCTTVHGLVRVVVKARLRETDPERYRLLVLRVAEHLRAWIVDGEPELFWELTDLVENPDARVGFSASDRYFADRVRPDDAHIVARASGGEGTRWIERFTRWCEEVPELVIPVRQATGELAAIVLSGDIHRVPEWASNEIEFAPILAHVEEHGWSDVVFFNDLIIVQDDADAASMADLVRVGNAAIAARSGLVNARHLVMTAASRREDDGSAPFGYAEIPELLRSDEERTLRTWATDFGAAGIIGRILSMIRAEQGVEEDEGDRVVRGSALNVALRSFHDDAVLAQSALGSTPEGVRAEVRSAIESSFGPGEDDRLLAIALTRTYLDVDGGHAAAMEELHMSRSSFYRHLQRARERLTTSG